MAAALLALIGWQAGPWQNTNPPQTARSDATEQPQAAPPAATPPVANVPEASPGAVASNAATDIKPSPMPPAQAESKAGDDSTAKMAPPEDMPKPVTQTASPEIAAKKTNPPATRAISAGPQPIQLVTSPGGATVTLDGRSDQACTTPCQIQALPGLHNLTITLPGYQIEHREVNIGLGPYEMPAVILHSQSGVLMLSSNPPGAAIMVNGKTVTEVTPAKLSLAPGTYKISVEKNGQSSVSTVEIKNGDTRLLKVTLGQ